LLEPPSLAAYEPWVVPLTVRLNAAVGEMADEAHKVERHERGLRSASLGRQFAFWRERLNLGDGNLMWKRRRHPVSERPEHFHASPHGRNRILV
jgi:hypothetical protein